MANTIKREFCSHIQDPSVPRHTLPCRHVFCLNCTRGIEGLMEDELFSCPTCGNFSQYVDAFQTVGGQPETVAQNSITAEGTDVHGGVEPPDHVQSHDEREGRDDPSPTSQYDQGAHTAWQPSHVPVSQSQPMDIQDTATALPRYESSRHTQVNDTTRKDQDQLWQQLKETGGESQHQRQQDLFPDDSRSKWSHSENGGMLGNSERDGYCQEHPGYMREYYCDSCDKLVCDLCKRREHHLHKTTQLESGNKSTDSQRSDEYSQYQQQDILDKCKKENAITGESTRGNSERPPNIDKGDVFCKIHQTSELFFFCNRCNIPICTHCTTEMHESHPTMKLVEDTKQYGDANVHRICQDHTLPITYYCRKCKNVACTICREDNHKWCFSSVIPIGKAKDELAVTCENLGEKVQKGLTKLEELNRTTKHEHDDNLRKGEALKHKVQMETRLAREKLEANEAAIIASINTQMQASKNENEERMQFITDIKTRLDETVSQIASARALAENNDLDTAKACTGVVKENVTSCLDELRKCPTLKSFNLECRTNPIPVYHPRYSSAPVYLTDTNYRSTYYPHH